MPESGKDVLVVDDERHIVRLVQVNLEREGFEVRTAFDGQAALLLVGQCAPGAIVLDLRMPIMDGFEFLAQLRANPETAGIPVIVLTGYSHIEGYVDRCAAFGCVLLMTRPFDPLKLVGEVREILKEET